MSLSWSALHGQLLRQSSRLTFQKAYGKIRQSSKDALSSVDPPALLSFLHDPGGTAEAKNKALRAIVAAAQNGHPEVCSTLLLLALWPGLDAARSRLRCRFPTQREAVDADLVGRLTLAIRTCDLARVERIAATLLRNVERDATRSLVRSAREVTLAGPMEDILDLLPLRSASVPATQDEGSDIAALRDHLRGLLGPDAHLVLLVVVGGCTQREAGEILGLSHDAVRKRFQRAIARLKKLSPDCPIPRS